jgi:hypothetical protein
MELTPEDRQRIEEEERKRLAEEQYRAQVRRELAASQAAAPGGTTQPHSRPFRTALLFLGVVIALCAIWLGVGHLIHTEETPEAAKDRAGSGIFPPKVRYVPVSQKIANGQIVVKARGHVQYRIRIDPEMSEARISGSFNASGGLGNDIGAAIADENEFLNYINGHEARVLYGTKGQKTTDRFDVRLRPGTYILVFSNRFSALTDKQVFLDVDLNYSRRETY